MVSKMSVFDGDDNLMNERQCRWQPWQCQRQPSVMNATVVIVTKMAAAGSARAVQWQRPRRRCSGGLGKTRPTTDQKSACEGGRNNTLVIFASFAAKLLCTGPRRMKKQKEEMANEIREKESERKSKRGRAARGVLRERRKAEI